MVGYCSPARENQKLTCYSMDGLKTIAELYNEEFSGNRIKIQNKTKKELWDEIRKKLSQTCNDETCWVNQNFVLKSRNKELLKDTFRPKRPKEWDKNATIWLNTDDILNMMKQYEEKYPDFIFIGPVPRDCKIGGSLQCELTNFDIGRAYDKGIRKIGIVYNNDYSYQSGSHWNCVFIDMENRTIDFYDSYGYKPLPEVFEFMRKNAEKLAKKGMKMKLRIMLITSEAIVM